MTVTWIVWTVECNAVEQSKQSIQNDDHSNVEFIGRDVGLITHMELEDEKRIRRDSAFDRGYNEFLRNYHKDNGVERHGRYQVNESDENESAESSDESDEDDDNDDDDDESESNESEESRKKYRSKPQKTGKNKKAEQNTGNKKKSKHCKTEKKLNMICNICYDPKNDRKEESCSYNSDPKEKNYAYSEDSSYSNKNPESLEGGNNDDDDEREGPRKKRPPQQQPPVKKYPGNHRHQPQYQHNPQQAPRFYGPAHPPRANGYQNYGPQTFLPQSYQPISMRPPGRPIRIRIKNGPPPPIGPSGPPPNVALIRYRTVEPPFGSQHIRLITYPSGPGPAPIFSPQNPPPNRLPPQPQQPQYYNNNNNNRPVASAQELRPPRDINGAHSESLLSNVTKEHLFEYLPNHMDSTVNSKYEAFISKDWSRCIKTIELNQVCFECYVDGERRKECMFANVNRPDNFYKSYSTSKKFNTNHPYEYDMPVPSVSVHTKHSQQNSKSHSTQRNKNKDVEQFGGHGHGDDGDDYSSGYDRFENELKTKNHEKRPTDSDDWDSSYNDKPVRPQSRLPTSVADIIYGTVKAGQEPLALFFKTDPTTFDSINTLNNHTTIDTNGVKNITVST